ncbi:MAG: hypothetical protein JO163_11570 [Methylobacteriaceae bacterium]|nr:hypothetical protein [Methylobacteriaceae bacterium]MBV9703359.1 hypothetical protein [Methylobacteriaceae bacterium]
MRLPRVLVRLVGMIASHCALLLALVVLALAIMLGGSAVRLCGGLVVFGSLRV